VRIHGTVSRAGLGDLIGLAHQEVGTRRDQRRAAARSCYLYFNIGRTCVESDVLFHGGVRQCGASLAMPRDAFGYEGHFRHPPMPAHVCITRTSLVTSPDNGANRGAHQTRMGGAFLSRSCSERNLGLSDSDPVAARTRFVRSALRFVA